LAIVLLIGLVGGLAMGSVAAARRTASSFMVFWASTNPSDLTGATGLLNPELGLRPYEPDIIASIAHLPGVKSVVSQSGLNILPLGADNVPRQGIPDFSPGPGNGYASVDGAYFRQDRASVLQGRMANPANPHEFMLSAPEAQYIDVHVGDTVRFGIYTNAQFNQPGFGTARVRPYRVVEEKLVGIAIADTAVIEDQADQGFAPDNFFTPALTRQFLNCCVNYTETGIQVAGGLSQLPKVTAEVQHDLTQLLPEGTPTFTAISPTVIPKAQRSLKPIVIALGTFGAIVALACLLIVAQLIGRQVRAGADERWVLRALGADPHQTWADGLVGMEASILLGSLLAALIAFALSPIAPLGPVRPVYPDRGVNFDWTVLGGGAAALAVLLGLCAAGLSWWDAPHRLERHRAQGNPGPSRLLVATAAAGLPPAALTGVGFALVPGHGRSAVPVRSAVLGAVMAVVALVGTATFGASLSSLVSHPALYGWNWDYLLEAGANLPEPLTTTALDHDRYVSEWTGVYTASMDIDGQLVPVAGVTPAAPLGPAILSGHEVLTAGQVVLGASTLRQLHVDIGKQVTLSVPGLPGTRSHRLRVVGTATLPALGGTGPHLEMGSGAVVPYELIPAALRNLFDMPNAGPEGALVRLRQGVHRAAAYASLQAIAERTTTPQNFGVSVIGVQRPAEILNYRTLGSTPAYLGAGLAAGALAALALTLLASVRRRRRDLALLKALGFTKKQLAATVAWHSTTTVTIGVIFGVPIGVAVGRALWDLFANDINAVPVPSVPFVQVVLIAVGALVLANLVAALPALIAARTPSALALRAE
jgi:ABC-type antimicrobial peptide transport system permease subunit